MLSGAAGRAESPLTGRACRPHHAPTFKPEASDSYTNSTLELRAILAKGSPHTAVRSLVFGCSPPKRPALNPLTRNEGFVVGGNAAACAPPHSSVVARLIAVEPARASNTSPDSYELTAHMSMCSNDA